MRYRCRVPPTFTPPETASAAPRARFDRLDALRAVAIVWMAVFHFAFDLDHFGYVNQDFLRDPLWTLQRTAILGTFLLCAGLGQAIALEREMLEPVKAEADVVVLKGCGLAELDEEALRSFRVAGPFPNPPAELVKNGVIVFEFGFFFEVSGSRTIWRQL